MRGSNKEEENDGTLKKKLKNPCRSKSKVERNLYFKCYNGFLENTEDDLFRRRHRYILARKDKNERFFFSLPPLKNEDSRQSHVVFSSQCITSIASKVMYIQPFVKCN